jgi:DNA polymerase (family 10)
LKGLPLLLRRLRELRAADAHRIETLAADGILTLNDLELAIAERRPGFDTPAFRAAASVAGDHGHAQLTLGRAWDLLEPLLGQIETAAPQLDALEVSGDIRRFEPLPHHLVIVARAADAAGAAAAIASGVNFSALPHRAARRLIAMWHGHEIDIRVATPDEFGTLLFTTTGPATHVASVLARRGRRLSAAEADVYSHAGLPYVPPELRGAPGDLDGAIPALVTRADIRGDLHMHTTYSDGADSLSAMVAACCALGYEYIAITDHSEHAAASRTLDDRDLLRQRDEIARVRTHFPQIAILHGIEADILEDGSLDCPDAAMASLDIVLASLHERGSDNARQLTERCLKAIHHPLVSVITHPQNQIVGRRAPYDMDYEAIYAAAAETGTALEIDGAPAHLDLDGARAREAVARGVTVSIDSDCHRAAWLERQMYFGVGTARRGGVEPRHVLNTRPLADVRAFIARKRRGWRG